jgi:endonuclease I
MQFGRKAVAVQSEHQAERRGEQVAIGPCGDHLREAGCARRIKAWTREAMLQFAQDAPCVAKEVGADLHHRNPAIAAGERSQIGFRRHARLNDGAPVQPLDPEGRADFFRERRARIVMQDDFGFSHRDFPRARHAACRRVLWLS